MDSLTTENTVLEFLESFPGLKDLSQWSINTLPNCNHSDNDQSWKFSLYSSFCFGTHIKRSISGFVSPVDWMLRLPRTTPYKVGDPIYHENRIHPEGPVVIITLSIFQDICCPPNGVYLGIGNSQTKSDEDDGDNESVQTSRGYVICLPVANFVTYKTKLKTFLLEALAQHQFIYYCSFCQKQMMRSKCSKCMLQACTKCQEFFLSKDVANRINCFPCSGLPAQKSLTKLWWKELFEMMLPMDLIVIVLLFLVDNVKKMPLVTEITEDVIDLDS